MGYEVECNKKVSILHISALFNEIWTYSGSYEIRNV